MSTTTINDAAVQKQLRQGRVKKTIFSIIRHLILALLAFIGLVPIAWLLLTFIYLIIQNIRRNA